MTTTSGLNIPEKQLSRLSQVGHGRGEMQAWVNNLPIMNTAETGKKLYQTLGELATLHIDDDDRYELVEILEPAVTNLIRALSHGLQNQPVKLPHAARRAAVLSQALHLQLALDYKVVAVGTLQRLEGGKVGFMNLGKRSAQQLAANAVQRCLGECIRLIRHAALLYFPLPDGVWLDIHSLFRLAWTHDLIDVPVKDRHSVHLAETSIRHTYLRAVMLGASQTNKLRPSELDILYAESESWATLLKLETSPAQALLVCDADDLAPGFRHRAAPKPGSWFIRSEALVQHFQANPGAIPASLQDHLLGLWRRGRERMFERRPCEKPVLICLGLSAAHYFLAGQREFRVVVKGNEEKKTAAQPAFLFGLEEETVEEQPDAWQISYATVTTIDQDADRDKEEQAEVAPAVTYVPYHVEAFNVSPGGYGIRWPGNPPASLRPGEIIAISEERGKGWNVGLLHWVRMTTEYQVEAGLELLSAQAKPCGICRIRNLREDSDYLRGFLIPEMKSLDQPATLVTSGTTFAVGSDVKISLAGQTVLAQLTKLVLSTASISQYEFAVLNTSAPVRAPDHDATLESNIDAMWEQLKP
ncbi:hypothetical protein EV700_1032 [Fluviicoccus keumensis]|uniref:GTPase n=1 Tax=Fluviicoccus keumensis TaxID=1435465 RepID=A0A4Q7ZBS8_9GAMM|nr:hypothetical protein [Fluviicoccus keumensis]RZU48060.1 hypothetical protein EV700_1032 [Fluviicoccus keumensis]